MMAQIRYHLLITLMSFVLIAAAGHAAHAGSFGYNSPPDNDWYGTWQPSEGAANREAAVVIERQQEHGYGPGDITYDQSGANFGNIQATTIGNQTTQVNECTITDSGYCGSDSDATNADNAMDADVNAGPNSGSTTTQRTPAPTNVDAPSYD